MMKQREVFSGENSERALANFAIYIPLISFDRLIILPLVLLHIP